MPALEASSHFPLWERSWAEKISFGPKQCCLGAVIVWMKSSYSPFPLQYSQTYIFLLQWCAGNSPLGTWTSPNVLLSLVIVQSNIFQGLLDRGQEGLEPVHGPFKAHSQRTKVSMSITWYMGGQDSSWVSWRMVLDPTAPRRTFLLVNRCQIVVGSRGNTKIVLFSHDTSAIATYILILSLFWGSVSSSV